MLTLKGIKYFKQNIPFSILNILINDRVYDIHPNIAIAQLTFVNKYFIS